MRSRTSCSPGKIRTSSDGGFSNEGSRPEKDFIKEIGTWNLLRCQRLAVEKIQRMSVFNCPDADAPGECVVFLVSLFADLLLFEKKIISLLILFVFHHYVRVPNDLLDV